VHTPHQSLHDERAQRLAINCALHMNRMMLCAVYTDGRTIVYDYWWRCTV